MKGLSGMSSDQSPAVIANDKMSADILSNKTMTWTWHKILDHFQKIFIYFWVASILGHYLEVFWSFVNHYISGGHIWHPSTITLTPLAPPYGFGALAVILLSLPLIKRYKLNPLMTLILNILVTGAIEYLCAAFLVLTIGHNQYWNYSHQPFNISGYVCLQSAFMFGVAATLFLYFIYPLLEKLFMIFKKWQVKAIFWILFITFLADLLTTYIRIKFF
jgi:uncharacterized membrane protein